MRSLMLMLGAIMIILLLSPVVTGIQDFRSTEYTEAHGSVTTAAAVTTANVTLTQDLFEDRNSEVVSVTSNVTSDVPLVSTYTAATNYLYISGLTAATTRTLTVKYHIANLEDFYGIDLASRTIMTFIILGVIGIIAAAVYNATRRD